MIDRRKFDENFQLFEKDVIIEIIDIFESEYEERFSTLEKNIKDRDFNKLKFNAHSLKGVIANFMDPVAISLSHRFDDMAKSKDEKELEKVFSDLRQASSSLLQELRGIKTELIG
jgi:HPt (histidine-containing phosphotransfer) domain-containing protein